MNKREMNSFVRRKVIFLTFRDTVQSSEEYSKRKLSNMNHRIGQR